MNAKREWATAAAFVAGFFCAAGFARAADIYKADNDLPLNDPLSWEGETVPGAEDMAVFDERVTTNTLSFLLTNDLAWAGVIITNSVAPTNVMIGTASFVTNGVDAATLTLGSNGVCVAGSGLALTLNVPLALSDAQTWQMDRRNLTFGDTVSGTSDWALNMPSQTLWNVASGYSGNLMVTNSFYISRFYKAGRWAKSFTIKGGGRWEMPFTGSALWTDLFIDRLAAVTCWTGITAGGTLQFEDGDTFQFPWTRFTLDNGYAVQNGGDLSGYELQAQYSTYSARHTVNNGTLSLTGGLLIGNGASSLSVESRFLQKGGTVSVNSAKVGWSGGKYWGLNTLEVTGGVFRISGSRGIDTGVHLSWSDTAGSSGETSGIFLMEGGWADVDQIAFGRSQDGAVYATTNAFSMFKMTGGELVLGSRGLYAGRSWNNGNTNSGYQVKLQGGTLTAGDSWSSQLDLFLSDANGGTAFNTADTNGVGQRVVLNGALYGPGALTKRGAGTLVLAGAASYEGKTTVEEGTLAVGGASSSDCYRWTADSLTDTNTPVATWTDVNGGVPATNAIASQTPRLVLNELNGHNVVRFSSGSSQYLAISAADSPISGATAFSIAVVFKTGSAGAGGAGYWYSNTGLLDAEQGGIQNDWGMGYNAYGQVGGGAGYPSINKDTTVYSDSGYSVVNSQPHVAIYTWKGTNFTMNVDGRVATAFSTATTVSARNTYRMLFGSMNQLSGYFFNGDMAEIRIYRNRALSVDEQNLIGNQLAATYGVPGAVFKETGSVVATVGEIVPESAGTFDPLPYDAETWDADTLSGTNGSAVSAWASTNGLVTATLAGVNKSGVTAPALVTGAINGHQVVRFTSALKTGLGIPADESPIAGSTNFTVAFVFRTTAPGKTATQWYSSIGVIDAEQPGGTYDWGIAFTGEGRVAAGIGLTDTTSWSKLFDLHDGMPHAAVVSYDALSGYTRIMVDGLYAVQSVGVHATPRNAFRIVLGSLNALDGQFFTGDLAAFRLFPERALTESEMTALSTEMTAKYGVLSVPRGNTLDPQPTGLGRRGDVEVCAGAALVLPVATNSAVTLTSGQTISGGGTVRGTLALASGATVDIGLAETLTMEDLWLQDGARVCWNHSEGVGNVLTVASLKTGAAATLVISGGNDLPARVSFLGYTSGTNLSATDWTVVGGKTNTRVEANAATQTLDLVTPRGTMVLVR